MDIVYFSNAQIPSRSTNALQVMRMCAGFRRAGAGVTLVHPRRIGNRPEGYDGDLWSFYGIAERFPIVSLPTPLTRRAAQVRVFARPIEAVPLATYLAYIARPGAAPFVAYARSLLAAWLIQRIRRRLHTSSSCRAVVVELHDEPRRCRDWNLLREVDGVVVISAALRERLIRQSPDLADRVWVEHDGVDLRLFEPEKLDRVGARRKLGLSDEPVAVYTGRVNVEKGAGVLLDAAVLLDEWKVVLVGRVYERAFLERRPASVLFTGFVPPRHVPTYLAAADVLVLPSTDQLPYAAYTSPLKLFEYMASGRPIIASDLPALREVLRHEENALLFKSGDADALASAATRLLSNTGLAKRLQENARADAASHSWDGRASRILDRLDRVTTPPMAHAATAM
jgi:glycosyltransferase involved in cell wall biosynthesis